MAWAVAAFSTPVLAAYPEKPIRLIVPFSPGGGGDVQGRLIAASVGARLHQPIVVENRAGAGGNIGTTYVAHAEPDGYTLLLATAATVINPTVWAHPGFDAHKDLVAVAGWSTSPLLILANPAVPVHNLHELVDYAHSQPGKLSYASGGIGIITDVEMAMLDQNQQLKLLSVPYPGQAPAVTAVVGGYVGLISDSVASGLPFVKGDKLRALAVTSPARIPSLPDVPTVTEQGYPELARSAWYGLVAPAGTPPAVLKVLSDAVSAALDQPETRQRLANVGAIPFRQDYVAFQKFMDTEGQTWAPVVVRANLHVK
ncbi:Bug family tripartite tricarboxylate transporter substrate binding protein [Paraburkholderia caballeronis]|nr:tripartite tricarboxylate transporter substrate binding protein [Paraburkholderia caballeronis]